MLTMLPMKAKQQAVAEYFRVLKPGGILLTQDVAVMNDDKEKSNSTPIVCNQCQCNTAYTRALDTTLQRSWI